MPRAAATTKKKSYPEVMPKNYGSQVFRIASDIENLFLREGCTTGVGVTDSLPLLPMPLLSPVAQTQRHHPHQQERRNHMSSPPPHSSFPGHLWHIKSQAPWRLSVCCYQRSPVLEPLWETSEQCRRRLATRLWWVKKYWSSLLENNSSSRQLLSVIHRASSEPSDSVESETGRLQRLLRPMPAAATSSSSRYGTVVTTSAAAAAAVSATSVPVDNKKTRVIGKRCKEMCGIKT